MVGADDVERFIGAITPPATADGIALRKWRVNISIIVGALVVSNGFHIAWACGWLTLFGLTGFAQAGDMNDQKHALAVMQANQLDTALLNSRTRQCDAINQNNPNARQFATERLQYLLEQYQRLVGSGWRIPECKEL